MSDSPSQGRRSESRAGWLAAGLCALLSLGGTGLAGSLYINHDVAAYLLLAERLLDGATLYEDTATPNQPILVYLHLIPAALARISPLSRQAAFYLFVFALSNLCTFQSWRTLRGAPLLGEPAARVGVVTLLSASLFALPFARGSDFGQREQLCCALIAPYVLSCVRQLLGAPPQARREGVGNGVLAAVGFVIKPHFLALWLCCEVWMALQLGMTRSRRRLEPRVIAVSGVVYAALWAVLHPGVLSLIGPFANSYIAFTRSVAERASSLAGSAVVAALLTGFALLPGTRVAKPRFAVLGLGLCLLVTSIAIFWLQSGFSYHLYPVSFFAVSTVGWALLLYPRRSLPIATAVVLAALLIRDTSSAIATSVEDRDRIEQLSQRVGAQIADRGVMVLSTGMYPWYSIMLQAGARWTGSLWFPKYLAAAYLPTRGSGIEPTYHSPEHMEPSERFYHETIVGDLESDPPDVVIVSTGLRHRAMPGMQFDILRNYSMDPRFRRLWRHYQPFLKAPEFTFFQRDDLAARSETP